MGHTINNLTINLPTNDYVGLFGQTSAQSVVQNVGLVGGSVTASANAGALAGQNGGIIRNSYATGSVSGSSSVGGLAGQNYGTISNSYATGSVTSSGNYAGGLVGGQHSGHQISNSYATGQVSAGSYAGGLLGINDGGTISKSYSTGAVSGSNGGGLVGHNYSGTITNGYWDSYSSGKTNGAGLGSTVGISAITSDPAQSSAANYAFKQSAYAGFDFTPGTGTWFMVDGSTRPFLQSEYSTTINNAHQLQLMAMNLGASYTLGSNIDASATARALNSGAANAAGMWSNAGFAPIGKSTPAGSPASSTASVTPSAV